MTRLIVLTLAGVLLMFGQETKADTSKKAAGKGSGADLETAKAKAKAQQPAAAQREGYKIGPGDVIDVLVWKEPDASISNMTVRADGKISIPFLKDYQAAGFSPVELEERIKKDLGKYIQDPEVTVIVKTVTSEKAYVMGNVKKPGPLLLTSQLTVLQAISEAGGPTDYAKKKKMYILRNQQKIPFNYDDVIKGKSMEQNIAILPGDTIVVP